MNKLLKLNIFLFTLSSVVVGYLIYNHFMIANGAPGFSSFCSINSTLDCDVVNSSKFAEFLSIPVATWALGYYLLAIVLCFIAIKNSFLRREALALLLACSSFGVVASVSLFFIMVFSLKKLCLMCTSAHVLDVATFLISLLLWKNYLGANKLFEEIKKLRLKSIMGFAVLGFGFIIISHLISKQIFPAPQGESDQFLKEFAAQTPIYIDAGNSPRLGSQSDNPPIRIIEFADFQCPACGTAAIHIKYILEHFGNLIQIVFKNFPIDSSCNATITHKAHEHSCEAARAALCANEQGKFSEFYKQLFENQSKITSDTIIEWAQSFGMNTEKLKDCMTAERTNIKLQQDIALANSVGLSSTPTFFIEGRKVEGPLREFTLRALLKTLGKY